MNTIDTTLPDAITALHNRIDEVMGDIVDKAREALLDLNLDEITNEAAVAQIIMEEMFAHPCDPESGGNITALTSENKVRLVRMANHMGPDFAQALYHAAVFITKVAG